MSFDFRDGAELGMERLWIKVSVGQQRLELRDGEGEMLQRYVISTSRFGVGEESGSYRTPRGWHEIREKIGGGAPWGAQFVGRVPTGKVWPADFDGVGVEEDLILTRILWLSGLESRNANTFSRCIYIHGTQDEANLGRPMSLGCIRMRNDDVIDLYDRVVEGTRVFIE
jgi:lipoprotein-anchoring transpeptidase ErfK/SrfK